MYRIELTSGEETVFRTIEELATAIRNGVVSNRAKIYHNASQKWLPIEFHPHYKKALELPAAPVHPAESGPLRPPDFRSSGPQPALAPAHAAPVQQQTEPVQPAPAPAQVAPVQPQPAPVQHHEAPLPSHRSEPRVPVQHQPAPVHQSTPVQRHRPPAPHYPAPVLIPPPVPSPVLELTRPTFTPPSTQPSFSAPQGAVALQEPPPPPTVLQEPAPAAAPPSRSWIRGPIKLAVIGVIAIVCTRVVVSAAAPGSEARPLAETAPPRAVAQTTSAPESLASSDKAPGAVLTAGPAFSPAIVTIAQAAKAPAAAPAPAKLPAPAAASTDSIESIEPAPSTVDLALPAVSTSDSLAPAPAPVLTTSDSGAIRRILRAVTSSKPAPIKATQ